MLELLLRLANLGTSPPSTEACGCSPPSTSCTNLDATNAGNPSADCVTARGQYQTWQDAGVRNLMIAGGVVGIYMLFKKGKR